MKTPDIEAAVKLYYGKLEIGTTDIRELFQCGKSTCLKLKDKARVEMTKQGKEPFVPHHVSTKIAFEAWGLNIVEMEERLKKMRRI